MSTLRTQLRGALLCTVTDARVICTRLSYLALVQTWTSSSDPDIFGCQLARCGLRGSLPEFEQDLFLGIKYAPKPVRFTPAKPTKDTPYMNYNASSYGVDCTGYGSDTTRLVKEGWTTLGEDCLHLNIVRPRTKQKGLPVLLWIYGGGWQQGATSDPR
jgi:hypothetical protein